MGLPASWLTKRSEGEHVIQTRRQLATLLLITIIAYTGSGFACSANDVSKVKKKVADAAAILNTAAKSNRSLYQSGLYGAVGSPEAIGKRQRVATVIHQANEYLALAVERAASLQPSDLEAGKANIVKLLNEAVAVLNALQIDNENIRLVIQSAIAAINSAVTLTLAIKGA
jgi:hypothetical protein